MNLKLQLRELAARSERVVELGAGANIANLMPTNADRAAALPKAAAADKKLADIKKGLLERIAQNQTQKK
jgi:hypothetical protein